MSAAIWRLSISICGVEALAKPSAIQRRVSAMALRNFCSNTDSALFRKNEAVNDGSAEHTDRDLFDARHSGVEDRARRKHARKANQGRCIACEHEHVGSRRAI